MAHLMLTVGDMQIVVNPIPGDALKAVRLLLPDGHPLAVGDHVVTFYENLGHSFRDDTTCSATMGEAQALEVVGLWLTLETEREATIMQNLGAMVEGVIPTAIVRLQELMGDDITEFLP